MRRGAFRLSAAAGLLLSGLAAGTMSNGRCAERASAAVGPRADSPQAFARRVFAITDVVLDHHIDPPTRQQMILAGFKAGLAATEKPPAPGLGRRVSDVRTRDEFSKLLDELAPPGKRSSDQFRIAFIDGLLKAIPGDALLATGKEARAQMQFQGNRYVGLGIALTQNKSGLAEITMVIPGGPAEAAGVQEGDLILEIDHAPVAAGTSIGDVVERVRGDEGTKVTLRLGRPFSKDLRTLTIARRPVDTKSVEKVPVKSDPRAGLRVARLKINSITASTAQELRSWESKLESEGDDAVILDFRGAGGRGIQSDHSAVLLADNLLDGGLFGMLRTRQSVRGFTADRDCLFRDCPLAVLIDKGTSGAAEWVVAALQDADPPTQRVGRRALVVGQPTRGDNYVTSALAVPGSDDEFLILATGVWERARIEGENETPPQRSSRPINATPSPWRVVPDLVDDETQVPVGGTVINFSEIVANSVQTLIDGHAANGSIPKRSAPRRVQPGPVEVPDPALQAAVRELERQWKAARRAGR